MESTDTKPLEQNKTYSYKEIWLIAYPILISLIMEQMIGITDTAFLGRVGEVELGASAIAGVYYLAIFMIGFGFTVGSQILIARRNGEGNYRTIGNIFYQGIYFLMLVSAVIFTLSQLFSEQILGSLIASPHIIDAATDYIQWRVYGFFFSFTGAMFRAFFVGTTQTRTLTLNSVVMVLSNILFNYTLIFGKFGFPAMGIAGAAIGSSLAELVSVIFFITYTWRKVDYRKYGLNHVPGIRIKELKHIMSISLDHDTEFHLTFHVVPVLPFHRASGRTPAGHLKHYPKRIQPAFHDGHGICFDLRLTGQQPYRRRPSGGGAPSDWPSHPAVHLHRTAGHCPDCLVPARCTENLYGYSGTRGSFHPDPLGALFRILHTDSGEYLFPVGFGYGKYPDGIQTGTGGPDDLPHLHLGSHTDFKG